VIQQPQQAQIIQTSDGQTFIYQPMQLDGGVQQAQPTGIWDHLLWHSCTFLIFMNVCFILEVCICQNTNFLKQSPWEANSHWASQEIPSHFKKHKGSLMCSQEPITGPHPEPDESSPHSDRFLWFYSVVSGRCQNSALNYVIYLKVISVPGS
jgi:hypothetical protein